jgi:hypothetical protein
MEGFPPSALQEGEKGEHREAGHSEVTEVMEIPELALNLQAISIAAPRIQNLRAAQVSKDPQIEYCYNLLMKVACTGGTPRSLSHQAISQAMTRAWRHHFHAISQISGHLFMAHFTSLESMMFVYTRQPWTMGSDNILLEWIDPMDESKTKEDYKFENIYVNVRVYGVPRNHRSLNLLQQILSTVGKPSEFHPLQENMLFARPDYIWGTAKINIKDSVVDKINLTLDDNTSKTVYLHYEKIGRICLFCGIMFHTVQHCPKRNDIIMARVRNKRLAEDIPFYMYGEWIMNSEKIPVQSIEYGGTSNPILSRFRRMFKEDQPKDKGNGMLTEDSEYVRLSSTQVNYGKEITGELRMGQKSFPVISGQQNTITAESNQPLTTGSQDQGREGGTLSMFSMHSGNRSDNPLPILQSAPQPLQTFTLNSTIKRGISSSQSSDTQLIKSAAPIGACDIPTLQTDAAENQKICHPVQQVVAVNSHRGEKRGVDLCSFRDEERENNRADSGRTRDAATEEIRRGEEGEQEGQHGGRPSGWDVPPSGFGVLNSNPLGSAILVADSPDDRCYHSPRKMVRVRHQTSGLMGRPYPPPCKRAGPAMEPKEAGKCGHSPDSSEATSSHCVDAYSPPRPVGNYQMSVDHNPVPPRVDIPMSLQGESENISGIHGNNLALSEDTRDEDMELDRAMVPAHKAPRAP